MEKPVERTDEQIIREVLKGDKEAFGELVNNYTGLAYAICLKAVASLPKEDC